MKNLRFCAAALLLSAVIVISGYSILRSASGIDLMLKNKNSASDNSESIQNSNITPYDKQPVAIPDKPTELTPEILGSITIDSIPLSVPMKLGELPDEFSYRIITYSEGKDMEGKLTGKYTGIFKLIYNRQSVCNIIVTDTKAAPDENTIITRFNFSDSTNKYLPQITVAGFDASNTNVRDFNRIYGIDSDEYGYSTFMLENENKTYYLSIDENKNCITSVDTFDQNNTTFYKPELYFYGVDEKAHNDDYIITLPAGYSIENDAVNNSMTNAVITENNSELEKIINEIPVGNVKTNLPCTLYALMYSLDPKATLNIDTYYGTVTKWHEEYDVFEASGTISFGDEERISVKFVITPGQPLGDAQVIEISGYFYERSEELIEQIKADNPHGFIWDEEKEYYTLTDYQYNNVILKRHLITYSYWPENLTKQD